MAIVTRTTLTPSKLDLLASWLPTQSWYAGSGAGPELSKAGGFRLDDPRGEVGMEFMVVTDANGGQPRTYQVPVAYRGAPLDGADHALIGTTVHGELGKRWVYDGAYDPVLVGQLFALIVGAAEPQSQSDSDTADPSVVGYFAESGQAAAIKPKAVTNGPYATDLLVQTGPMPGPRPRPSRQLNIRVHRLLRPEGSETNDAGAEPLGHVTANWLLPDGSSARGRFAVVSHGVPEHPVH